MVWHRLQWGYTALHGVSLFHWCRVLALGIVALRCVQCACVLCLRGKASGIYWNCACIALDVICTLFTRKGVYF